MLFHSCNFRKQKRSCTKQNQANVEKETLKEKSSASDRTSVFKGSEEAHITQVPAHTVQTVKLRPAQFYF